MGKQNEEVTNNINDSKELFNEFMQDYGKFMKNN